MSDNRFYPSTGLEVCNNGGCKKIWFPTDTIEGYKCGRCGSATQWIPMSASVLEADDRNRARLLLEAVHG